MMQGRAMRAPAGNAFFSEPRGLPKKGTCHFRAPSRFCLSRGREPEDQPTGAPMGILVGAPDLQTIIRRIFLSGGRCPCNPVDNRDQLDM